MKWLAIGAAVAAGLWAWIVLAFPTYTHRFQLTAEVDTPAGLHSGSSVVEVERRDYRWILIPAAGSFLVYRVRGEAVFVDLGGGRHVVALLAFGPHAGFNDQMISLWIEAYGRYAWDEDVWSGRRQLQGPVELRPPLIPAFATFADLADPATVRLVQPYEFEQMFGAGVRLRRVVLEMVPAGRSGVPVTIGAIEQRLPWLNHLELYRRDPTNPFSSTLPSYIGALRRQDS